MQDMIQDFMTKEQVCKTLQISPRTLDLWRQRDGLPTVKIGHVCRFKREEVLEWFMRFQKRRETV